MSDSREWKRMTTALRKANYKTQFFANSADPEGVFSQRLQGLCAETSLPLLIMADILEAQVELLRDAEVEEMER